MRKTREVKGVTGFKVAVDRKEFGYVMSVVRKLKLEKSADVYVGRRKVVISSGAGMVEVDGCSWLDTEEVYRVDLRVVSELFGGDGSVAKEDEVSFELGGSEGAVKCGDLEVRFGVFSVIKEVDRFGHLVEVFSDESELSDCRKWRKLSKEIVDAVEDVKGVVMVGVGSFIWSRVGLLKGNSFYVTDGLVSVKREGDYELGEGEELVVSLDGVKSAVSWIEGVKDVGLVGERWLAFSDGRVRAFCSLLDRRLAFCRFEELFEADVVPVIRFRDESKSRIEAVLKPFRAIDDFVMEVKENKIYGVVYGGERGKVVFGLEGVELYDSGPFRFGVKVGAMKRLLGKVDVVCRVAEREDNVVMFIDGSGKCKMLYSLVFGSEVEMMERLEKGEESGDE